MAERQNHRFFLVSLESFIQDSQEEERNLESRKLTNKDKLSKMPCKVAVIDDAGYLMTNTFMTGHSNPKGGASTFDLFNTIGDQFWGASAH